MVKKKREEAIKEAIKSIRRYMKKGDSLTTARNKTAIDMGYSYPTIFSWTNGLI